MSERPCDLIAVTLVIAVLADVSTEDFGNVARYTGLFCDTYCHMLLLISNELTKVVIRNRFVCDKRPILEESGEVVF